MNYIRIAYLVHLMGPLLLMADRALAWSRGNTSIYGIAIGITGVCWFVIALAYILWVWSREDRLRKVSGPLLTFYTTVLCLVVVELGLRIVFSRTVFARTEYLYPPGSQWVLQIDPEATPGVFGAANFTINELGLRGPSNPRDGAYQIITVGGSTTECVYLDDSEEWPNLVMQFLNEGSSRPAVRVSNAGVGGHTSVDNLRFLQRLPSLRQADLLIFLEGVNDLSQTLFVGGRPSQEKLELFTARNLRSRFVNGQLFFPDAWLDTSLLYQLGRVVIGKPPYFLLNQSDFSFLKRMRLARARGVRVPLPPLDVGLAEYGRRIQSIGHECRKMGIRCLFLTQPTVWRNNLPPEAEGLLWMGYADLGDGRKGFVNISDLAWGMSRYNQTLQNTARENGFEYFDLAEVIPKDPSMFHDDCHFSEKGAQLVARKLADCLSSLPPFK